MWYDRIRDVIKYFSSQKHLQRIKIDDYISLPGRLMSELDPVFVLSTGRCGTEFLVKLFKLANAGVVFHEPHPQLVYASKLAYQSSGGNLQARKLAFLAARYDALREAYLRGQRYIETNNRITFFTDAIYEIFPKSKFIHLVRHPGDFVRSGIRRKYYAGHDYDDGRLTPLRSAPIYDDWVTFSQIKKIGWLWNETNRYIESLKSKFDSDRIITIKAENLFKYPSAFFSVCTFLDAGKPDSKKISTVIAKPINVQYKRSFPNYADWSDEQKRELRQVATLAPVYDYRL